MSTLPKVSLGFERTSFVPTVTPKENSVVFLGTSVNGPFMVPQFIPSDEFALKVFAKEVRETIEKVGTTFKTTYSNLTDKVILVKETDSNGDLLEFTVERLTGVITLFDSDIDTIYVEYQTKQGTLLDHYFEAKLAGATFIYLMRVTGSSSFLTLKDFKFESVFAGEIYNSLQLKLTKESKIITEGLLKGSNEKTLSFIVPFGTGFFGKSYNLSEFPTFQELVDRINDDAVLMDCPAIISTDNLAPIKIVNEQRFLVSPYDYFKTPEDISASIILQDDFPTGSIDTLKWTVTSPELTIQQTGNKLVFTGEQTVGGPIDNAVFSAPLADASQDFSVSVDIDITNSDSSTAAQVELRKPPYSPLDNTRIEFRSFGSSDHRLYVDGVEIQQYGSVSSGILKVVYASGILTYFFNAVQVLQKSFNFDNVGFVLGASGITGQNVDLSYDNFIAQYSGTEGFNETGIYEFSGGFDGLSPSPSYYFSSLDKGYKLLSQIKKFGIVVPTGVYLNDTLPRDIPVLNAENFPDDSLVLSFPNGDDIRTWRYSGDASATNGTLTMSVGEIECSVSLPLDIDERKSVLNSLTSIIISGQKDSTATLNAEVTFHFLSDPPLVEVISSTVPLEETNTFQILSFSGTYLDTLITPGPSQELLISDLKGFNLKMFPSGTGSVTLERVLWRYVNTFSRRYLQDESFISTIASFNDLDDPYFLYQKPVLLDGNTQPGSEFVPRIASSDPLLKLVVKNEIQQVGFGLFLKDSRLTTLSNLNFDMTSSGPNGFLGVSFILIPYSPDPPSTVRTYIFDKRGAVTLPSGSVLVPKKTKFDVLTDFLSFIADNGMVDLLTSSIVLVFIFVQGSDYTANINRFLPEKQYINDLLFAKRFLYFLGSENSFGNHVLGVMNTYDGTQGVNLLDGEFPDRIFDKLNVLNETLEMKDYLISPVVFDEVLEGKKTNLTGYIAGLLSLSVTDSLTNKVLPSTGHVFSKEELELIDSTGLMVLDSTSLDRFIVKGNTLSDKSLFNSLKSIRILQFILDGLSRNLNRFVGEPMNDQQSVLVHKTVTDILDEGVSERLIRDYDYDIAWDDFLSSAEINLRIIPIGEVLELRSTVHFTVVP